MHLFQYPILLYLSFHAIAGLLTLVSIFGIPGHWDETNPRVKKIGYVYSLLLRTTFVGLKWVFLASIVAFYFQYLLIGQVLSIVNLVLSLSLFISLVLLYKVK